MPTPHFHPGPSPFLGQPLAVRRCWLPEVSRLTASWGVEVQAAPVASAPVAAMRDVGGYYIQQVGRVAIVPLVGLLCQKPNYYTRYGLMTSMEQFCGVNELLASDPGVSSIVWEVNSPGGTVAGAPEAADRLMALRGKKKTFAVASSLMASGAYWLSCCADKVFASPSSMVGSVGVYMVHEDYSGANTLAGVVPTYVSAGKYKADSNADGPLTEVGRESYQAKVDAWYEMFVGDVATGRGTTPLKVRNGYGEGDVLSAADAVAAGLADKVATMAKALRWAGADADSVAASMAMAAARQRHALAKSK